MSCQYFEKICEEFTDLLSQSGTDLRIGQIGHGLGPRAFGGPAQLFL